MAKFKTEKERNRTNDARESGVRERSETRNNTLMWHIWSAGGTAYGIHIYYSKLAEAYLNLVVDGSRRLGRPAGEQRNRERKVGAEEAVEQKNSGRGSHVLHHIP